MTGKPATRGSPRRVVIAAVRTRAAAPGLRAASCMCVVVLLGTLCGPTTAVAARLARLPVLVQADFSGRDSSPTVRVAIRSAAGARCQVAVDLAKRTLPKRTLLLPAVTADTRGRAVVTWQVPAGTPSGRWAFDVSCAKGQRTGRGSDQVVVPPPSVSGPDKVDVGAPPPSIASFPGGPGSDSPPQVSGAPAGAPRVPLEDPDIPSKAPATPWQDPATPPEAPPISPEAPSGTPAEPPTTTSEASPIPPETPTTIQEAPETPSEASPSSPEAPATASEAPPSPPEAPSGTPAEPPGNPLEAELAPPPAAPQPASLESILPQARQIMSESGTVWAKAAAVRNLVRASLSDQNDCGVMAMAFWSVGSIVGLPLRLVVSSANGQNAFDTHATVEVWLAGLGRWAISDPTFNGFWSVGPNGPPVSAVLMRSAVRSGANTMLYWHGANTPNSLLPSRYYVDPTFLYPYIDFLAFVPNLGTTFMAESEADAFSFPYALIPTASADFETMPPDALTAVSLDERTQAPSLAGISEFTLPPRYAETLVYQGEITVGADGRARIPVANPGTTAVVSVETGAGNWQLEVEGGTTYALDPYPEARLSPIVFLGSTATLIAGEAPPEPVTVRVWTVKLFPASRETTSQWEGV